MKILLISLSVLFLVASCQNQSEEKKFKKQGVSFTIPAGWKSVDEEDFGDGYSLSIEKEGFESSGMVNINWLNMEIDLDAWASEFKDELQSTWNTSASAASFSSIKDSKYAGIPSRSVTYKMSLVGLKHRGVIHLFYKGGKSFALIVQEAIEDKADNKEGFKIIEKSFKVE